MWLHWPVSICIASFYMTNVSGLCAQAYGLSNSRGSTKAVDITVAACRVLQMQVLKVMAAQVHQSLCSMQGKLQHIVPCLSLVCILCALTLQTHPVCSLSLKKATPSSMRAHHIASPDMSPEAGAKKQLASAAEAKRLQTCSAPAHQWFTSMVHALHNPDAQRSGITRRQQ